MTNWNKKNLLDESLFIVTAESRDVAAIAAYALGLESPRRYGFYTYF